MIKVNLKLRIHFLSMYLEPILDKRLKTSISNMIYFPADVIDYKSRDDITERLKV